MRTDHGPKTAGITGHQDLSGTEWVHQCLRKVLSEQNVRSGITSLARGADQIFADCLLAAGLQFQVVLPCRRYEDAFSDAESRQNYQRLLALATGVETLDYDEPSEVAFFAAGRRVVELSDVMIAIWDGAPAKGLGGTADVVDYARARDEDVFHINPERRALSRL
jgi:hypothetical protein